MYLPFCKSYKIYTRLCFQPHERIEQQDTYFLADGSSLLSASTKELFFSRCQSGLTTRLSCLCSEPSLCFVFFSCCPVSTRLLRKSLLRKSCPCPSLSLPQFKVRYVCLSFGQWLVVFFEWRLLFLYSVASLCLIALLRPAVTSTHFHYVSPNP